MLGIALTLNTLAAPTGGTPTASNKQQVKIPRFNRLSVATVGTVTFKQAPKCSMHIYGSKRLMDKIRYRVDNNELVIDFGPDGAHNVNRGEKLYIDITAPTLKSIDFDGVGQFSCDSTIHIDNDLTISLNGVGDLHVEDLRCKSLNIEINGVGKAKINVQCQQHLDAEVSGIGSLTLRGRTATLSTDRSGIGRINTRRLKVGQ